MAFWAKAHSLLHFIWLRGTDETFDTTRIESVFPVKVRGLSLFVSVMVTEVFHHYGLKTFFCHIRVRHRLLDLLASDIYLPGYDIGYQTLFIFSKAIDFCLQSFDHRVYLVDASMNEVNNLFLFVFWRNR